MIKKQLSNSRDFLIVDDEDGHLVANTCWHEDAQGYVRRSVKIPGTRRNIHYTLHRTVLGLSPGDGKIVDHINRNKKDCRKANLRVVLAQQNAINISKKSNNTSGFRGVSRHNSYPSKPWKATLQCRGKLYYLGCFTTKEEAAKAYDQKAKELFGEFAVLNFPT